MESRRRHSPTSNPSSSGELSKCGDNSVCFQVCLRVEKIVYKCGLLNQLWLFLNFMIQSIINSVT